MSILATVQGTVTVTDDSTPSVGVEFFVTDDDAPYIEFTITERAAAALHLSHNALGIGLQIDRGDGVMVDVPEEDKVREFTIREDADAFGDFMTLKVAGPQYSPFDGRAIFRRRGNILAETVYGFGADEYRAQVFNGFVLSTSFDDPPGIATVQCGDAATLHAEKVAKDYLIPESSGWTRGKITRDLLEIGDIPAGELDFGPDDGGVINKAYAVTDKIVAWLRAFWRVRGREVGFIDNKLVVHAYDGTRPSIGEVTPANVIGTVTISAPATLDANVRGVVSVSVSRRDSLVPGAPVVTLTTTDEVYAPVTAAFIQDAGVVTENTVPSEARMMRTAELRTSSTKLGTVEVRYEEEEKAMWAPRAARSRLDDDPGGGGPFTVKPVPGRVYIFPDDSTRYAMTESLRTVRKLLRTKTLNDQNEVVLTVTKTYAPRMMRRALFTVDGEDDVAIDPNTQGIELSDDGQGVHPGVGESLDIIPSHETFGEGYGGEQADTITTTEILLNEDRTIKEEKTTEEFHSIGVPVLRRDDVTFGWGFDNRVYTSKSLERFGVFNGKRVTRKVYARITEDSYQVTTSILEDGSARPKVITETVDGSLPTPEKAEPTASSQEIRSIVKDQRRIDYAGGEEIEVIEHNEFIQNDEDADIYARYLARIASAMPVNFTWPFEAQAHKWKLLTVTLPGSAIDGKKVEVRTVERSAATHAETIGTLYYDPALS